MKRLSRFQVAWYFLFLHTFGHSLNVYQCVDNVLVFWATHICFSVHNLNKLQHTQAASETPQQKAKCSINSMFPNWKHVATRNYVTQLNLLYTSITICVVEIIALIMEEKKERQTETQRLLKERKKKAANWTCTQIHVICLQRVAVWKILAHFPFNFTKQTPIWMTFMKIDLVFNAIYRIKFTVSPIHNPWSSFTVEWW